MSTDVHTAPAAMSQQYRQTVGRALSSEWIKLRTVRSTWWSTALVVAVTLGFAFLIAQAIIQLHHLDVEQGSTAGENSIQPINAIVGPIQFTMLLAGILGVISVTGEYSTGMIRSTLTAVPIRGRVLASKAAVVAAFMFVLSLVVFGLSLLAISPMLAAEHLSIPFDDPKASTLPILYGAVALALYALIGAGIGFMVRNGAGAIAITVGLLFVLSIAVAILAGYTSTSSGWEWLTTAQRYLPSNLAAYAVTPGELPPEFPNAFVPLLWLGVWAAAALAGGYGVLRRRDA